MIKSTTKIHKINVKFIRNQKYVNIPNNYVIKKKSLQQ